MIDEKYLNEREENWRKLTPTIEDGDIVSNNLELIRLARLGLWAEEHGIGALKRFASIEAEDGDDFEGVHEDVIIRVEVTSGDIQATRNALAALPKQERDA